MNHSNTAFVLGPLSASPQLQRKLIEPRRHLLALYPSRYYTLRVAHAGSVGIVFSPHLTCVPVFPEREEA